MCTKTRYKLRSLLEYGMTVFVHIPKTGGTTLGFPLRRIYGWRATLSTGVDYSLPPDRYQALSKRQKRRLQLVKGHHLFGIHEHIPDDCVYFTLLREPVSRIASMHRMIKKEFASSAAADTSLKEFALGDYSASEPNGQTAQIAGIRPDEVDVGSEEVLKKAKRHLEEYFKVVGLTERYDETLILLKRRLGWEKLPYYVTSRVGKSRGEKKREHTLDSKTRTRIKEKNALDVRLYRYAEQKFEDMVAEEDASFNQEVERLRAVNRWVAPLAAGPLWLYRKGRRMVYKWKKSD